MLFKVFSRILNTGQTILLEPNSCRWPGDGSFPIKRYNVFHCKQTPKQRSA